MRLDVILRNVSFVLMLNGAFLLISAGVSWAGGDRTAIFPLLYTALVSFLFGGFPLIYVPSQPEISSREGLAIVVLSWFASCLVGLIPFVLWGGEFTFINAWFESVSGYTTTGSTVLTDIEALPAGLLFWRSATHWIGGIGIIVFVLAVLPPMGFSGMVLYRSEASSQAVRDFHYNARRSMQVLLRIYVGLTGLETVALLFCGMSLFDAVTHSFATIATGGFSPRNASIASYGSLAVELVVIAFMVLSGLHFGLLFAVVAGRMRDPWKSEVVQLYLITLLAAVLVVAVDLHVARSAPWAEAFRQGAFQVISVGTSTGFATADSSLWPYLSQLLLLFLTLQCACAGSTSGGIKVDRMLISLKAVCRNFRMMRHPKAVVAIKQDGKGVDERTVGLAILYVPAYLTVVFVSAAILTTLGVDSLSAFSGSAATMGNVGPGLGSVGSTGNFAHIPDLGKVVLTGTMLLGRLEIYGLLLCLMPGYWRE